MTYQAASAGCDPRSLCSGSVLSLLCRRLHGQLAAHLGSEPLLATPARSQHFLPSSSSGLGHPQLVTSMPWSELLHCLGCLAWAFTPVFCCSSFTLSTCSLLWPFMLGPFVGGPSSPGLHLAHNFLHCLELPTYFFHLSHQALSRQGLLGCFISIPPTFHPVSMNIHWMGAGSTYGCRKVSQSLLHTQHSPPHRCPDPQTSFLGTDSSDFKSWKRRCSVFLEVTKTFPLLTDIRLRKIWGKKISSGFQQPAPSLSLLISSEPTTQNLDLFL